MVFTAHIALVVHEHRIGDVHIELLNRSYVVAENPWLLPLGVRSGDASSGDTLAGDTAVTSTTQAAPPTVVSKLVRGGPATGGSSGAQTKRPSRSAM